MSAPLRRVGHKGADLIAPGNTLASFDAALAAGVDMIEFDVLPERDTGRLILAHDYEAAARESAPTLEQGLAHLSRPEFAGIGLDVDLKLDGYEAPVADALREHGLTQRTIVSSQIVSSLAAIRAHDPDLRLGWSVPHVRRDYLASRVTRPFAMGVGAAYRRALPARAAAAIRSGRVDALMSHWVLVTPRLVRAIADAGGELYVWTVDELVKIQRFADLGVTGVITNDPRLFAKLEPSPVAT